MSKQSELELEQAHVDRAYDRLGELRARVEAWRAQALLQGGDGTVANRFERDRLVDAFSARVADLEVGGDALCFGRLDLADGESFHLGRVGVADESGDPLLVDWRAPVASAFYRATPLAPLGVARRRHLLCRGREVVALDDDLLELEASDATADMELVGEAALLEALGRSRTGRMRDIVATIQADQDRAVRAPLAGVLVVEGGPGTGKTAVALHRAAYLLYAERLLLETQGILVVGPSPAFCRYVSQVLPSLGEQGVRLATIAELAPVRPAELAVEPEEVARLKGDGRMAGFLAAAVRSRQRPLRETVEIPHGAAFLRLTPEATARIVRSVRARGGDHNHRRPLVERLVLTALWEDWKAARARAARLDRGGDQAALAARIEAEIAALDLADDPYADEADATDDDGPDPDDGPTPTAAFADAVRQRREWRRVLDRIWPLLEPTDLLRDLYGSPGLLRAAARRSDVHEDEALTLHRPRPPRGEEPPWTEADLPLLDEAAVLLGPTRRRRARPSAADPAEQQLVEETVARVMEEVTATAGGVMTALDEGLELALETRLRDTVLGQVRAGPTGDGEPRTFGHVVVDEAQELSAMAWRMLHRRCPRRSFTVVGDLDQAAAPGALRSWDEALAALGDPPSAVVRFTVNYRTPAPVMELAAAVVGSDVRSARAAGDAPRLVEAGDDVAATVLAEVERLEAEGEHGQVAVVAPPHLVAPIAECIGAPVDTADVGGVRRVVLDPRRAKGLEFDAVVVVDPLSIAAAGPSGRRDLYVSLTRTTDRLTVIGPLPPPA